MIFILDDDDAVRAAMCLLVRAAGWTVRAFANAEECLAALAVEVPRCLVLDIAMPGMTGADLVEALPAMAATVPFIVVTALAEHPLAERLRAAGARAVLAKPFLDDDLLGHIEAAAGPAD